MRLVAVDARFLHSGVSASKDARDGIFFVIVDSSVEHNAAEFSTQASAQPDFMLPVPVNASFESRPSPLRTSFASGSLPLQIRCTMRAP